MEKDTETKHFWKSVVIEEYYTKEDGDVYWNWRFAGTEEWNKFLAPYKEIPYWIEYPRP